MSSTARCVGRQRSGGGAVCRIAGDTGLTTCVRELSCLLGVWRGRTGNCFVLSPPTTLHRQVITCLYCCLSIITNYVIVRSVTKANGVIWTVRFSRCTSATLCVLACTVCLQMNGAVSNVNKKFISHLTRAQPTPSAAATVQVSHALPAVRFSCLLRGRRISLQDGVAARKGFLCAPF